MKEFCAIQKEVHTDVLRWIRIFSGLICNKISPAVTVIFKIHDIHSDSIHYQAVETLSVVGIVVPEQLGCIYFQGHIRV